MADTESNPTQPAFEGETPSPLCNYLLEQARLLMAGEITDEQLREGVSSALQSLEQAREQTLANLERDGAKDAVVEAFERSFEEMQVALEDLEEFSSHADDDGHESVRGSIFRAASATVFAMNSLQQAQFSEGPTDMPLFNALFKMKEGFLKGGVEADQLQEALAGIVDMTKKAIEELLAAEGEQPPQRDGLVRAYEEQIQNLELAGETVESGDKVQLEAVFENLLVTSNGVKEAMGSLNLALMSEGPCRMVRTNVLLSAAETFRTGGIGPDAFAEAIEAFESQVREESAAVQEVAAIPTSASVQKEVAGVKEAYDLHEDALALFSEILEGDTEPAEFDNAKKLLIEASEKLSDHKEALIAIGETEGKVPCVRCGTMNEQGSRVCNSCGAQLPQLQTGQASTMSYQESDGAAIFGGELEMTTNLEKLFQAVNELAEERCSDEEFEEILLWMDGLLVKAQATMPEVPDLTPHPSFSEEAVKNIEMVAEDLHDQRALMLGGMADFQVALGTLQSYFETRDKESLMAGVREVRSAAVKMQQAEKALTFINDSLAAGQKAAAEAEGQGSEAG
jgi:tetratricopeptide (TPR) repeat protein